MKKIILLSLTLTSLAQAEIPKELALKAQSGKCYVKISYPERVREVKEKQLVKPSKVLHKVIPAEYMTVEQEVVVQEAHTIKKIIPAKMKVVKERVLVKDSSSELTYVPAKYEREEKLVKTGEKSYSWKKGENLLDGNGDIVCLEESPKYKKVVKVKEVKEEEILKKASGTESIDVERLEVAEEAKVVEEVVPAVKKKILVKRLVKDAEMVKEVIPAEYKEVTKTIQVSPATVKYEEVICKRNISSELISRIQNSLNDQGYVVETTGQWSEETTLALKDFQEKHDLPRGYLDLKTLAKLKVL